MKTLRFITHLALITSMVILLCFDYSSAQNSFPTPTGPVELDQTGAGAGSGGEIRLLELNANGSNYVGWKAPDNIPANVLWTLPEEDGGNGNVLSTNGSGILSFVKRVNTDLSNLKAVTAINSSLVPGVNNSLDLGSTSFAWRNAYFLGSVGIGTTSPDNDLHVLKASAGVVTGNSNAPLVVENSTSCYINLLAPDANERGILFGDPVNSADGGIIYSNASAVNGFQFRTGGNATRMTITSAGDVGIETNTPGTKLHILGGTDASFTTNGFLELGPTTGLNVIFDDNEIMARDAGVSSTLFLQNSGGDLSVSAGALLVTGSTNIVSTLTNMVVGGTLDVQGASVFFGSIEAISDGGADLIISSSDFATDVDGANSVGTSTNTWFDVWATDATINTSDARLKENIADLGYGLPEIMQMRPVSYTWLQHPDAGTKLGFLAQEVQSILPEAVRDWEYTTDEQTGKTVKTPSAKLGMQYDAIIPVLVKAIQEQNAIVAEKDSKIDNQQQQLSQLTDRIASLEAVISHPGSTDGTARFSMSSENAKPVLGQNIPNPFDNSTLIPFRLPKNCKDASLRITETTTGSILRVIPLVCGETQISIEAGQLASGNYTYSLYVDGNLIDTKQMVLTK